MDEVLPPNESNEEETKGKLMNRIYLKLILIAVCTWCLTGCWDKVEINELAIGEMIGADFDPETGKQIVYYQIVNPVAVSAQNNAGIKSPFYTYTVKANSISELGLKVSGMLPRNLFPDHYQSEVISERYARQGLKQFLNFYERQYNRRSNLYLFVADSPISDIMMTYTPLERLSGRAIRSLVEHEAESTGRVSKKSRVKDLTEHFESSVHTVLPMIRLSGSKPWSNTDRFEHVDANKGNLVLSGGAVFKQDRMIGKIGLNQMAYYVLLKGDSRTFFETLSLQGSMVDLQATKPKVRKRLILDSGAPVWKVDISTSLTIMNNNQNKKMTLENMNEIKEAFDRQVAGKTTELFKDAMNKNWDLFGLEDKIKNKRGKAWEAVQRQKNGWNQTRLLITVKSRITNIGEIIDPYKGG